MEYMKRIQWMPVLLAVLLMCCLTTIYGAESETPEYDIGSLSAVEGVLHTVYRYRNLYPTAIKLVSQGKIPLKSIVSHVYKFDDIIEGVNYNIDNKADVIKAVIEM